MACPTGQSGEQAAVRQAVLLVGGFGTRLRPLTNALPKALIPVANLPLIAYEIIPLVRAGVRRIIFAMGYKADLLREHLGDGSAWGAEFVYVEEAEPLDTAGALANVASVVDGPFFACNGDMIYDVDLVALAQAHVEREALVTFCLRRTPDIQHFGLIQWTDDRRVLAFREKVTADETGRNTVNSGYYVMSPEVFMHIPPSVPYSSERQLFPDLLARGARLFAHVPEAAGYWADVGRIETYLQANRDVLGRALGWFAPQNRATPPASVTVADTADLAADVTIGPGAVVGDRVAVGAGCTIGAGARLEDSILWPGSRIGAGAQVKGSIIAGASVAPGVTLDAEVMVVG